jgi:hypothetical protein
MRLRPLVLGAVLLTMALAAAGCTSAGANPTSDTGGGTPAGTVTVKADGKVVCVIALKGGRGTCKVNTGAYPPGTVKFSGSYGGGAGFKPSHSGTVSLKLLKAAATTSLSLSVATAKYGDEQAARLRVRVVPRSTGGQTPSGKVTVRAGGTVVCVITLASGTGSCAPAAKELAPGRYRLSASYPGSTQFTGSVSGEQTLVVAK